MSKPSIAFLQSALDERAQEIVGLKAEILSLKAEIVSLKASKPVTAAAAAQASATVTLLGREGFAKLSAPEQRKQVAREIYFKKFGFYPEDAKRIHSASL